MRTKLRLKAPGLTSLGLIPVLAVFFLWVVLLAAGPAPIDLAVQTEFDLGQPVAQFRGVPVTLGKDQPPAVAALYGSDAEIDPYIGMF